jgi:peptidylprolyl isomerase
MPNKIQIIIFLIVIVVVAVAVYYFRGPKNRQLSNQPDNRPVQSQSNSSQSADLSALTAGVMPQQENAVTSSQTENPVPTDSSATQATSLQITTLKEGAGAGAKAGNKLTVHYIGTLASGTKFDSSRERGEPFIFTLGAGEVIRGWDQGMVGMKVGETRKLVIPPALGYGSANMGAIPPNSTLIFEVELLKIN